MSSQDQSSNKNQISITKHPRPTSTEVSTDDGNQLKKPKQTGDDQSAFVSLATGTTTTSSTTPPSVDSTTAVPQDLKPAQPHDQKLSLLQQPRSNHPRVSMTGLFSKVSSHLSEYNKDEWATAPSDIVNPSRHIQTVTDFQPFSEESPALRFTPHANHNKARAGTLELPHGKVQTPVFMPVGTQGTIKGICAKQVENMDINLILGNTYHLGVRPGTDIVHRKGGLHQFMNWGGNMLSDSGGFQMVSLVSFTEISETGVQFQSPVDGSTLLLTPERSIQYQNELGTDIMMALDDVCSSLITGPRVEEAMERSIRWLDRCIGAHKKPHVQNLFAIIQGGLDRDLRIRCLEAMIARNTPGYAIGGLAGGEDKESFWNVVDVCTDHLPTNKPRYLMGVGYPIDLLVCVAMGVDMFDCVWPCRTARFGTAIVPEGLLKIHQSQYANDNRVLCESCPCDVCSVYKYPRSYLHHIASKTPLGCHLMTIHNLGYLKHYMDQMRQSIMENRFETFVHDQLLAHFPTKHIPAWVFDSLTANKIDLANESKVVFVRDEKVTCAADVHVQHDRVYQTEIDPKNLGLDGIQEGVVQQPQQRAASHQRISAVNSESTKQKKKQHKEERRQQHIEHAAAHLKKMQELKEQGTSGDSEATAAGSSETTTTTTAAATTASDEMKD